MEFGAQAVVVPVNVVKGDDDHDPVVLVDQYYPDLINLPPGFRFHPTDDEIITHYLTPKVINPGFTASAIGQVDLNKIEPWDLPQKAKMGEKEWFFFCQRDRKYPTGMRTNRATESGYWKATGKDKEIYNKHRGSNSLVGMKKTLVFYKGRAPKGDKTNWVMHEFRIEGKFSYYNFPKASKDEWVVCRVVHKNSTTGINNKRTISSTNHHQELTRMNSFVNGLLDNPSSLLPLLPSDVDDKPAAESSVKNNNNNNGSIEEYEIKGKNKNSSLSYSTTGLNTQYNTFHMPPYNYNFNSNTYMYQGSPVIENQSLSNFHMGPSSGGDRTPVEEFIGRFKVEQYLSPCTNQSISHSQDTGLSTAHDINTEISSSSSMAISKQEDVINPLHGVPSFSDFDSFWGY